MSLLARKTTCTEKCAEVGKTNQAKAEKNNSMIEK